MGSADMAARIETSSVRVRFLSALRDRVGTSESVLVLPTGCTLHQVSQRLLEAYGLDAQVHRRWPRSMGVAGHKRLRIGRPS
jgi:molybdopterin converting factor small subunit